MQRQSSLLCPKIFNTLMHPRYAICSPMQGSQVNNDRQQNALLYEFEIFTWSDSQLHFAESRPSAVADHQSLTQKLLNTLSCHTTDNRC